MIRTSRRPTARRRCLAAAALLISVAAPTSVLGQWTVTVLHPAGTTHSTGEGVSDTQQVGIAVIGGNNHAALWSGSAGSWLDLNPAGATESAAFGTFGPQQVGNAIVGGILRASVWSGTAASWTDLNPAGATASAAYGNFGSQQVGFATVAGIDHASLWNGAADSWVDLNPAGSPESLAEGTSGDQQVGYTYPADTLHAALWSGTAESWVDLNPTETGVSIAYEVSGGQQVGVASFAPHTGGYYASLWTGSPESWVNLNPAGASSSSAAGVSGGLQVGRAVFAGNDHAALWSGTAESFEDLHAFVPAVYSGSRADAIWSDGNRTYIIGAGFNSQTHDYEALLWTRDIVQPPSAVTEYGVARYVGYSQTSDDPPSTPESWTLIAIVVTDTPDAMLSASVSFDVPPPVSFEMNVANAYIRQYLGSYFPDEAAFLLAYPETTYTVTVDLGAGPVSGDVFVPADLYCPEIPALTGDTFDRLQAHDTSRAFDGTINGFTLAPGTSEGSSTVTVIQIGEPTTAWSANLQPGDTEFQIPAGVLLPGTNYSIGISYFNVALTSNAGFGAATARTEYFRGTGALFATLPFPPACAADFNADGAVNSQDFFDFLAAFFAGTPSADFNHDGVVNSQDFFELLTALFAGC